MELNMTEIDELKMKQKELVTVCEDKESQIEAAQLAVSRLQKEKDQLNQALSFLENRTQVYRNTILDYGIVVKDESKTEWRHGFNDPRFSIFFSKDAQTDLTSDELSTHERDFVDLREKLKEVQKEFSMKNKNLHEKFYEIEENLILKTKLVETLTEKLKNAEDEIQSCLKKREDEREIYQKRINELGKIAERISFAENEYERIKNEKSQLELKFEEIKQEYEEGLEDTLNGSMKKYQEQAREDEEGDGEN